MKNHGLGKKESFLLYLALYCMEKEVTLVQYGCSSFKERPCFLPHFLINFLLSSQKIYLDSYPKSPAACFSYNLTNMTEYKDRCQVIISLFWTLLQLGYYLVTRGERVRQHHHCGMRVGDFSTAWGTTLQL